MQLSAFKTLSFVLEGCSKDKLTAQGREFKDNNTGIVIHNCTLTSAPEFIPYKATVRTYIGRPWKEFSRTIIMQSFLDDLIDLVGWLEFNGTFALSTLYYAEYGNFGPGAHTEGRVNWPGYLLLTDCKDVENSTVKNFICGLLG
ncbi:hypothetical protein POUND7_000118 [Theobroma cacao]